jgi:phage regulator Rha-like protein
MNDLPVVILNGELRTDSRDLASLLDHRHRNIFANIKRYENEMAQLSIVRFENARLKTERLGEREQVFAMLTEDQCYFLLTLMRNNETVVKAKLNLVKAFRDARTQLAMRDIARVEGKEVRKVETGAIAKLVDYATASGSKNASRYYGNVTRMTNDLLGIKSGERDNLGARELNDLAIIERIVTNAISDGIAAGMNYKDVYQLAKNRCGLALPAIGVK